MPEMCVNPGNVGVSLDPNRSSVGGGPGGSVSPPPPDPSTCTQVVAAAIDTEGSTQPLPAGVYDTAALVAWYNSLGGATVTGIHSYSWDIRSLADPAVPVDFSKDGGTSSRSMHPGSSESLVGDVDHHCCVKQPVDDFQITISPGDGVAAQITFIV